jgi:hypothetical protein
MPYYDSLWKEIDSLIPGLNLYITKKNIQDVAIKSFKTKFEERIKKEKERIKKEEEAKKAVEEAAIRDIETNLEKRKRKDIEEQIQTTATAAVTNEIMASQIKQYAKNAVSISVKLTTPTDAVTYELLANQIKEAAINGLQSKVKEYRVNQIILKLIKLNSSLIKAIIAIKEAAMKAVSTGIPVASTSGIETLINSTAIDRVTNELISNQIKQSAKDAVSKSVKPVASTSVIKASIETTAIDRVTTELISSKIKQAAMKAVSERLKIKPIEESIKTTAINAVNVALSVKPIDSRPLHSKFDVLITDKTYEYDEKTREQKEITRLTKNDTI